MSSGSASSSSVAASVSSGAPIPLVPVPSTESSLSESGEPPASLVLSPSASLSTSSNGVVPSSSNASEISASLVYASVGSAACVTMRSIDTTISSPGFTGPAIVVVATVPSYAQVGSLDDS